ncbi:hypothetical protein GFK82_00193 [Candidatus Steffania adelgidicola]|nr:hypothetical protein GFK82_00193 [Candidatus Steffania adelgidicola]
MFRVLTLSISIRYYTNTLLVAYKKYLFCIAIQRRLLVNEKLPVNY